MQMLLYFGAYLAAALILALLLRRFVCLFAYVKGSSMMNTLRNRDVLFALRYHGKRAVRRFDVVLCRYPKRKELFVKRVIGLPGERISMQEGVVFINEAPVSGDFPLRKCLRSFDSVELGADEYFVMGDNRPASVDSRRVGALARSAILARVYAVVYPFRRAGKL